MSSDLIRQKGSNSIIAIKRVMIFIDGGFLRSLFKKLNPQSIINYEKLISAIKTELDLTGIYFFHDIIRIYYYDAFSEEPNLLQNSLKRLIKELPECEDKAGVLVESNKRREQKQVDTLLVIDLLSKSYQNQFDIAILISADSDFIPLIKTVKDTGKKIFGIVFEDVHYNDDYKNSFDRTLFFDNNKLKNYELINNISVTNLSIIPTLDNKLTLHFELEIFNTLQLIYSLVIIKENKIINENSGGLILSNIGKQIINLPTTMTLEPENYELILILYEKIKIMDTMITKTYIDFKNCFVYDKISFEIN